MSAFQTYMKTFKRDLQQTAVWPPGSNVQLGDYGRRVSGKWQKLGSIWDLIQKNSRLAATRNSKTPSMKLGSGILVDNSTNAKYDDAALMAVSASIKFDKNNSVFVSASDCETTSLTNVQMIGEALTNSGKWNRSWSLVSEIFTAEKLQVVIAGNQGEEAKIEAKTHKLLEQFTNGTASTDAGIKVTGQGVVSYIGESGPLYFSLAKAKRGMLGGTQIAPDLEQYSDDEEETADVAGNYDEEECGDFETMALDDAMEECGVD